MIISSHKNFIYWTFSGKLTQQSHVHRCCVNVQLQHIRFSIQKINPGGSTLFPYSHFWSNAFETPFLPFVISIHIHFLADWGSLKFADHYVMSANNLSITYALFFNWFFKQFNCTMCLSQNKWDISTFRHLRTSIIIPL